MARYINADNLKLNFASYLQRGRLEKDEAVYRGEFYNWRIDGTEIKEAIDREPTADVRENVRGEWKESMVSHTDADGVSRWGAYGFSCSVCHKSISFKPPYCPNCGADMRGESKNER